MAERFRARQQNLPIGPLYNIAPTDAAPVVLAGEPRELALRTFGIKASWMDSALINIRAEGFPTKPFFQRFLKSSRCLIPADGFFEWTSSPPVPGTKKSPRTPIRFSLKDGELFGFAGVYDPEGFAIITTEPNPLVGKVHNRMPVIVRREEEEVWLDPKITELHRLITILAPYPAGGMTSVEVSKAVNSPKNKSAEVLTPVPENPTLL